MSTCAHCAASFPPTVTTCPSCSAELTGSLPSRPERPPIAAGRILLVLMGGGLLLFFGLLAAMIPPAILEAREAARRGQCLDNLRQIGQALHEYHRAKHAFPPAWTTDEEGRPLHSWRVLILPWLGYEQLYAAYDFSQPWDAPANRFVLENMPPVFSCPSHSANGSVHTCYAAVAGRNTVFEGADPVRIRDITDGTDYVLMIGEAAHAEIPWTSPRDVLLDAALDLGHPQGFSSLHRGGVPFLLASGATRVVSNEIDRETLQKLLRRNHSGN